MNISQFFASLQSRRHRRLWLTLGTAVAWVLTAGIYLYLTDGGGHPAVSGGVVAATVFITGITVFLGFFCRSEWQGTMAGSGSALLLAWVVRHFSSGENAQLVALYGLCPILAGFWGAWGGRLFASAEGRRERHPAVPLAFLALVVVNAAVQNPTAPAASPHFIRVTFAPRNIDHTYRVPAPRTPNFDYLGMLPLPAQARFEPSRTNLVYLSPDGDVAAGAVPVERDRTLPDGRVVHDTVSHAVLWRTSHGLTDLGEAISPETDSYVTGVSADGTTVAGRYASSHGMVPFVRGAGSEPMATPIPPAKKDGAQFVAGTKPVKPFVWRTKRGVVDLSVLMARAGADGNLVTLPIKAASLSPDRAFVNGVSQNKKGVLLRWRLHLKQ